jgi:RimJ/RimL family protein N-acetyltransferase
MNLDCVFNAFPRLQTERFVLRQVQLSDIGALFTVLSDEEVTKFYDDEAFTDMEQARKQIQAWASGFQAQRSVRWGIARQTDDAVVGTCGYYGFHTRNSRGSIGYELARPYWRQGIMTEALEAILEFGFREIGLNRIQAVVMPGNVGSEKLLGKLGFRREGLLREYENWGAKGFVDVTMFSLLKCEYQQR